MPNKKNTRSPVLAARCTKQQKKRIRDAERSTGQNETDFILAAITEFFAKHRTPVEQMKAVQAFRLASI